MRCACQGDYVYKNEMKCNFENIVHERKQIFLRSLRTHIMRRITANPRPIRRKLPRILSLTTWVSDAVAPPADWTLELDPSRAAKKAAGTTSAITLYTYSSSDQTCQTLYTEPYPTVSSVWFSCEREGCNVCSQILTPPVKNAVPGTSRRWRSTTPAGFHSLQGHDGDTLSHIPMMVDCKSFNLQAVVRTTVTGRDTERRHVLALDQQDDRKRSLHSTYKCR